MPQYIRYLHSCLFNANIVAWLKPNFIHFPKSFIHILPFSPSSHIALNNCPKNLKFLHLMVLIKSFNLIPLPDLNTACSADALGFQARSPRRMKTYSKPGLTELTFPWKANCLAGRSQNSHWNRKDSCILSAVFLIVFKDFSLVSLNLFTLK